MPSEPFLVDDRNFVDESMNKSIPLTPAGLAEYLSVASRLVAESRDYVATGANEKLFLTAAVRIDWRLDL